MTITVEGVRTAVHDVSAKLLDGRRCDLVGFGIGGGSSHYIEVHSGVFHWLMRERDRAWDDTTEDLDEALHWITLDPTRNLAMEWEIDQRDQWSKDRDTRIGWLAKQVELLHLLDWRAFSGR